MDPNVKDVLDRHNRWDAVLNAVYDDPDTPKRCPFCGQHAVRATWALFDQKNRGASLDVWCEHCHEGIHLAALLPNHAPDQYPPGEKKPEAELTKHIFKLGSDRGWW